MHRTIGISLFLTLILGLTPLPAQAAGGIYASGGGTKTVGQTFSVTVKASGVEFDSLQGQISVSGPVSIVSFNAGSGGTWLPGKSPSNGGTFVGITGKTSSLTIATINLKATGTGNGAVSVNGPKLAKSGAVVSTDGGGTSFTINRAPTPPGGVSVTSTTHPDQNTAYEAKTIELAWTKATGVTGFSYLLDQSETTTPSATLTSETSIKYENKDIGTYYFHIRAKNGDGFGPTTHYKLTIKEPDPKVDEGITKAAITGFTKTETFKSNVEDGTISGFIVNGVVPVGYIANLVFTPALALPEGKSLSVESKEDGAFEYAIDFPVKSGFYKVTVQGQKDKTLTPVSDTYTIEVSVARGGSIRFITTKDTETRNVQISVSDNDLQTQIILYVSIAGSLVFLGAGSGLTWWYFMHHRQKDRGSTWRQKPNKDAA